MAFDHPNVYQWLTENPVTVMAPLSGITDAAFREICRRQGCRFLYAEMTSSEALVRKTEKAFTRIHGFDTPVPVVAQLLGNNPQVMADSAALCVEMGADAVDINLGCPAKRIVKGGGGSALMREPKLVGDLVRTMVRRIDRPVSVKIRAGWDNQCQNAVEIAHIVESEGAQAIAVHPRTRQQAFKGTPQWEVIARVKQAVRVPVIGNGDIQTREQALRMRAETGCDAVMVGRAALGRPWIFRILDGVSEQEPDLGERIQIAIEHLHLLAEDKGDSLAAIEFRKHLACYLKSMPSNKQVREKMAHMTTVANIVAVLEEYREKILAVSAENSETL